LSEARRISHAAGLTVFALVFDEPQSATRSDALAGDLGRAGADRVLLCEGAGLPNYVKTSGQTGLHVLVPLAEQQPAATRVRPGHPGQDTPGRPAIGAAARVSLPDGRVVPATPRQFRPAVPPAV